jgi:hypothetical protein
MNMIPKNRPWSAEKIARSLKGLTVPASRSKTFRMMAAASLRAGRKATPGEDSDAHFSLAASYKSLAHDNEWMYGERQRSHERKSQSTKRKDG